MAALALANWFSRWEGKSGINSSSNGSTSATASPSQTEREDCVRCLLSTCSGNRCSLAPERCRAAVLSLSSLLSTSLFRDINNVNNGTPATASPNDEIAHGAFPLKGEGRSQQQGVLGVGPTEGGAGAGNSSFSPSDPFLSNHHRQQQQQQQQPVLSPYRREDLISVGDILLNKKKEEDYLGEGVTEWKASPQVATEDEEALPPPPPQQKGGGDSPSSSSSSSSSDEDDIPLPPPPAPHASHDKRQSDPEYSTPAPVITTTPVANAAEIAAALFVSHHEHHHHPQQQQHTARVFHSPLPSASTFPSGINSHHHHHHNQQQQQHHHHHLTGKNLFAAVLDCISRHLRGGPGNCPNFVSNAANIETLVKTIMAVFIEKEEKDDAGHESIQIQVANMLARCIVDKLEEGETRILPYLRGISSALSVPSVRHVVSHPLQPLARSVVEVLTAAIESSDKTLVIDAGHVVLRLLEHGGIEQKDVFHLSSSIFDKLTQWGEGSGIKLSQSLCLSGRSSIPPSTTPHASSSSISLLDPRAHNNDFAFGTVLTRLASYICTSDGATALSLLAMYARLLGHFEEVEGWAMGVAVNEVESFFGALFESIDFVTRQARDKREENIGGLELATALIEFSVARHEHLSFSVRSRLKGAAIKTLASLFNELSEDEESMVRDLLLRAAQPLYNIQGGSVPVQLYDRDAVCLLGGVAAASKNPSFVETIVTLFFELVNTSDGAVREAVLQHVSDIAVAHPPHARPVIDLLTMLYRRLGNEPLPLLATLLTRMMTHVTESVDEEVAHVERKLLRLFSFVATHHREEMKKSSESSSLMSVAFLISPILAVMEKSKTLSANGEKLEVAKIDESLVSSSSSASSAALWRQLWGWIVVLGMCRPEYVLLPRETMDDVVRLAHVTPQLASTGGEEEHLQSDAEMTEAIVSHLTDDDLRRIRADVMSLLPSSMSRSFADERKVTLAQKLTLLVAYHVLRLKPAQSPFSELLVYLNNPASDEMGSALSHILSAAVTQRHAPDATVFDWHGLCRSFVGGGAARVVAISIFKSLMERSPPHLTNKSMLRALLDSLAAATRNVTRSQHDLFSEEFPNVPFEEAEREKIAQDVRLLTIDTLASAAAIAPRTLLCTVQQLVAEGGGAAESLDVIITAFSVAEAAHRSSPPPPPLLSPSSFFARQGGGLWGGWNKLGGVSPAAFAALLHRKALHDGMARAILDSSDGADEAVTRLCHMLDESDSAPEKLDSLIETAASLVALCTVSNTSPPPYTLYNVLRKIVWHGWQRGVGAVSAWTAILVSSPPLENFLLSEIAHLWIHLQGRGVGLFDRHPPSLSLESELGLHRGGGDEEEEEGEKAKAKRGGEAAATREAVDAQAAIVEFLMERVATCATHDFRAIFRILNSTFSDTEGTSGSYSHAVPFFQLARVALFLCSSFPTPCAVHRLVTTRVDDGNCVFADPGCGGQRASFLFDRTLSALLWWITKENERQAISGADARRLGEIAIELRRFLVVHLSEPTAASFAAMNKLPPPLAPPSDASVRSDTASSSSSSFPPPSIVSRHPPPPNPLLPPVLSSPAAPSSASEGGGSSARRGSLPSFLSRTRTPPPSSNASGMSSPGQSSSASPQIASHFAPLLAVTQNGEGGSSWKHEMTSLTALLRVEIDRLLLFANPAAPPSPLPRITKVDLYPSTGGELQEMASVAAHFAPPLLLALPQYFPASQHEVRHHICQNPSLFLHSKRAAVIFASAVSSSSFPMPTCATNAPPSSSSSSSSNANNNNNNNNSNNPNTNNSTNNNNANIMSSCPVTPASPALLALFPPPPLIAALSLLPSMGGGNTNAFPSPPLPPPPPVATTNAEIHSSSPPSLAPHPPPVKMCQFIFICRALLAAPPPSLLPFLQQLVQCVRWDAMGGVRASLTSVTTHNDYLCHSLIHILSTEIETESQTGVVTPEMLWFKQQLLLLKAEILHTLPPPSVDFLHKQIDYFARLTRISGELQPIEPINRSHKLQQLLSEIPSPPLSNPPLYLPTHPPHPLMRVMTSKSAPMQSHAKAPYLLTFTINLRRDEVVQRALGGGEEGGGGEVSGRSASSSRRNSVVRGGGGGERRGSVNAHKIEMTLKKSASQLRLLKGDNNNNDKDDDRDYNDHNDDREGEGEEEESLAVHEVSVACIFKMKDDCRQDALALQLIGFVKHCLKRTGVEVYLRPYSVITTGNQQGIIEVVPHAKSRDQLGKTLEGNLFHYFKRKYGPPLTPAFERARRNFILSLAGYSLVSFLLQIKDRHNGNILVDDAGHLIHIDFGFIFDISPGGNLKFERAPFKLSQEFIDLMGSSSDSPHFKFFSELLVRAFLAIRSHAAEIIALTQLMTQSQLPCFRPATIENLSQRLAIDKTTTEAAQFMLDQISYAYKSLGGSTRVYDRFQAWQNGIEYDKS